jgi:sugar lactone lactonase YvrE
MRSIKFLRFSFDPIRRVAITPAILRVSFAARRVRVLALAVFTLSFCGAVAHAQVTFAGTQTTLGGGFSLPAGVAVDSSRNVYVADTFNNVIKEMPAGCGSASCVTTLGGGFSNPLGVAVDGSGNVYVADTFNSAIKEMPAGCGSSSCVTTLGSGFSGPFGVAVDRSGDVYVADSGNSRIEELQLASVNFASANVCPNGQATPAPCSQTLTLNYNVAAGTTIGSVNILTTGAPHLDFQAEAGDTSTTLCSPQTYASATACTVDVTFAPRYAGTRNGGVKIVDGSGDLLASTPIYGTGVGPQLVFRSNNIQSVLGGDFPSPWGVAVDGSGNVYVGDYERSAVEEIPSGCASSSCVITLGGGFSSPLGVAVDGSGNVYVTDYDKSAITEMPPGCASSSCVTVLGGGFTTPEGVAVDGSGNIYVADSGQNNAVKEIPPGCFSSSCVTALGGGFSFPHGVAVDGSGNVYVADTGSSAVKEMPAGCGSNSCVTALGDGFSYPLGVAVDGSGDVYVADTYNYEVKKLDFVDPPSLTFASTNVGATSSDSPQSVLFQNIGNAPLTGSGVLSDILDFAMVPGSGTPADCTPAALSLAAGAECNLSLDFTPQSPGPLSGTVTLTDINLNAAAPNYATQVIQLSGTGISVTPIAHISTGLLNFGSPLYGSTSVTMPLTITNTGGGTLTVAPSINGPSYSIVANTCTGGVVAGNNCMLTVQFNPVSVGNHHNTLNLSTNAAGTPTVSLQGTAAGISLSTTSVAFNSINYGSPATQSITVTDVGLPGTVSVTGAIDGPSYGFSVASSTCATGVTAGNTCSVVIQFNPVSLGVHHDTLILTPSTGSPVKVTLSGTANGVQPTVYSLSFGSIGNKSTTTLPLAIQDYSVTGPVTVSTSINGPSYKVTSNGCTALTTGGTCILEVEFAPTTTGAHNDTLTVTPSTGPTFKVKLTGTTTP